MLSSLESVKVQKNELKTNSKRTQKEAGNRLLAARNRPNHAKRDSSAPQPRPSNVYPRLISRDMQKSWERTMLSCVKSTKATKNELKANSYEAGNCLLAIRERSETRKLDTEPIAVTSSRLHHLVAHSVVIRRIMKSSPRMTLGFFPGRGVCSRAPGEKRQIARKRHFLSDFSFLAATRDPPETSEA